MTRTDSVFAELFTPLKGHSKRWLVTGCAGFIGSNLIEALLENGQEVIGLDNFSTGHAHNLHEVERNVGPEAWGRFRFVEGDIRDLATCHEVSAGVDYILHQAALGSVPRSLEDPLTSNEVNVTGHLNMLIAARDAKVKRFVYAASSSTYGDHPGLPKVEDAIGKPLSPYAVTKYVNELYADVFARTYDFHTIGLRYFNIFGKRQTPDGAYAAIIPKWTAAMIQGVEVYINGDGETSRDFNFIENAVQANILAATANDDAKNQVYNVAVGGRTTLNTLFMALKDNLNINGVDYSQAPIYRGFREGDVRHSQANISKIQGALGYDPQFDVVQGIKKAMPWYVAFLQNSIHG